MALLTTEDVLNKKFQYVKFREGYDQVEVDDFLDEVVSTIYSLNVENQDLKEKLEAAERRIVELSEGGAVAPVVMPVVDEAPVAPVEQALPAAAPAEPEQSVSSMLSLAQKVHDEYVRDGKEESERIIAEARSQSEELLANAQREHEKISAQLDRERGLLEGKINELRTFESEYRSKLRGHLEGLLRDVDAGLGI